MNKHKLTLLALLLPVLLFAQKSKEIGGFIGASQYQGDLAPTPIAVNETKLALGGLYRYMFTSNFGIRGTVTWAQVSGDDRNRDNYLPGQRSWSMRNNIIELAVHSEWIFFGTSRYNNTGLFARRYSPFVSVGLGAALTNVSLSIPADDKNRRPEPTTGSTFLVVPITAGMRLDVTDDFLVTAEFGTRAAFTDYIDGVSVSGNPQTNDWYFFAGISIVYVLEEIVGSKAGR